jgi:5-methylcytosine-specific restriction endonuclease McrA
MNELSLPDSAMKLSEHLLSLAAVRQKRHEASRRTRQAAETKKRTRRMSLTPTERFAVKSKTGGLCHICGGPVGENWQADHVLCHSSGGPHSVENYLAAHPLCNNYRWDYSPEEFQWILKIGVWARTQMANKSSGIGSELAERFFQYEVKRQKRRAPKTPDRTTDETIRQLHD